MPKIICIFPLLLLSMPLPLFAEGVSITAQPLLDIGGLPITNSMVTSWVVSLILVLIIF